MKFTRNTVKFVFRFMLAVLVLPFFFRCEGDNPNESDEDEFYLIKGIVIDQVTRLPVVGAKVFASGLPFGAFGETLLISTDAATSNLDGKFEISMPVSAFDPNVIRFSLVSPRIYASASGYVGSNYFMPLVTSPNTIELYHPVKLILSVKNDTISNDVDDIDLALTGSTEFMSYPGFVGRTSDFGDPYIIKECSGRTFEAVYEFYPLWGNATYFIKIRKPDYPWRSDTSVILKPDSIDSLSILF